ncbi:unnamed protein product, partial [Ixodes persulcatus]
PHLPPPRHHPGSGKLQYSPAVTSSSVNRRPRSEQVQARSTHQSETRSIQRFQVFQQLPGLRRFTQFYRRDLCLGRGPPPGKNTVRCARKRRNSDRAEPASQLVRRRPRCQECKQTSAEDTPLLLSLDDRIVLTTCSLHLQGK